jgi:uncharacterized protein YggE
MPFQFSVEGASSEAVTRELAQKTTRALDTLKLAGVADSDTVVNGPRVSIRYEMLRDRTGSETREKRVPAGYAGQIDIRVTLSDLDKAPRLFATMAENGALLMPPRFYVEREADEQRRLGAQAVKIGVEQARAMIAAAGGKPGRIVSIVDGQPYVEGRASAQMRMGAAPPEAAPSTVPIPIRPGKATLERTMTVQMEIISP